MEKLKPCPFCGGNAEMNVNVGSHGYTPDIYYARCKRCGAKIEIVSDNYDNLSTAVINAWNKRVNLETYTRNMNMVGMIGEGWRDMTSEEAIKILEVAKAECEWSAPLEYQEAFDMAIEALRNSAELISWLDECIGDEHTTPIERATLMAVKCKVEGIVYAGNI